MASYIIKAKFTDPENKKYQFPIHYAYNYLHSSPQYLQRPQLQLNKHLNSLRLLSKAKEEVNNTHKPTTRSHHAIDVFPLEAKLPWHSGIITCRQSKHWQLMLDTTRNMLERIAASNSERIASDSGKLLADIAREELASNIQEGWAKFTAYVCPEADEQRSKLLAAMMVFIFVFDDFWEMRDISSFSGIRQAFISRMQPGGVTPVTTRFEIESVIDEVIVEILELDLRSNSQSGKQMLEELVKFFSRPAPPSKYSTMRDFLLYRHEDAGVMLLLSCVRFSLDSSVDIRSARLLTYIGLVLDQVSIMNDLASWEKEKRAYDMGKVLYLINIVDVVKQLLGLPTYNSAIEVAQGVLFQVECQMDKEIQRLVEAEMLTDDERVFLDASLFMVSGNVLTSIVMSRYGGEYYRLK